MQWKRTGKVLILVLQWKSEQTEKSFDKGTLTIFNQFQFSPSDVNIAFLFWKKGTVNRIPVIRVWNKIKLGFKLDQILDPLDSLLSIVVTSEVSDCLTTPRNRSFMEMKGLLTLKDNF